MVAKLGKTLILLFWFAMMGLLIHRTYLRPTVVIALDAITEEGVKTGEEWFGIYQQGRKIGFARSTTLVEGDAYHLAEESEMEILALGKVQHVRTKINAYTSKNFQLSYFDFALTSNGSAFSVKGAVVKKELVLDITTGGNAQNQHIPLTEPIYLAPNIRPAIVLMGLDAGKQYRFSLFNPATLGTSDAVISVESKETIKVGNEDRSVYKLKESFQGMESFAWITQDGETLKEESPLGYSMLKETQVEAKRLDKEGPAVDVISLVRIPSADLGDSSRLTYLKARLSGAPLEGFELDGFRQTFKDGIIEVRTGDASTAYPLPFRGQGHAGDLKPTALIQSDDPAIREQTGKIVGKEQDARSAALKLNTWVYDSIVKQPVVSIPSAIEVLKQRVGDCNEHTTLYTAMARAAGLPTRMAAGIVYLKNGFYYHAWPEIWLGAWVAIDPTFGQFPADATHIRFVTGDLGRQADIVRLVGKLKVDVLEYR
ncbi:MAG: transglutaminase-like domain-containing protein [Nitrospiraceae bacterium]|nr:transglutaminase-like domain-containing protein [Nitrospiraceae bacterium]